MRRANGCGARCHKRDEAEAQVGQGGPNYGDETGLVSSTAVKERGQVWLLVHGFGGFGQR